MIYSKLGNTEIEVSKICLGTMTWGVQNSEEEAFQQMDMAIDYDVNFFDTAEMYPIPPSKTTQGLTETYIGNWLQKTNNRDKIILASKAVGPGLTLSYIRKNINYSKNQLRQALESSLARLKTDYIDLYQLHWPERHTNFFGRLNYKHVSDETGTDFLEIIETLNDFIKEGKIRQYGLSNETPWGLMKFIDLAKQHNLTPPVSIQNPYSLLNRTFEIGLSEIAMRENAGLLAYSPLAMGMLSGKYIDNEPPNARLTLYKQYSRYSNERAVNATKKYVELAKLNKLSPAQMALAFINQQPFTSSNIIGATNLTQLKENIESINIKLSDILVTQIETIHSLNPNPAP